MHARTQEFEQRVQMLVLRNQIVLIAQEDELLTREVFHPIQDELRSVCVCVCVCVCVVCVLATRACKCMCVYSVRACHSRMYMYVCVLCACLPLAHVYACVCVCVVCVLATRALTSPYMPFTSCWGLNLRRHHGSLWFLTQNSQAAT